MSKHQDSWPETGGGPPGVGVPSLLPSPPRRTEKTSSRSSLRDKPKHLNTTSSPQPAASASTSQDDFLSSNLSPRSTTVPLIELGTSLENMFLSKFHSLDNLDGGFAKPGVTLSGVTERQWNMSLNVNNLSLDTMITLTEFRSLDIEDKHKVR